MELFEAAD
jgi:hypothetical protein